MNVSWLWHHFGPLQPLSHSHLIAHTHANTYTHLQMDEQFARGRLHAVISSRPGQTGRVDGYILEGKELEFYLRQLAKKKKA